MTHLRNFRWLLFFVLATALAILLASLVQSRKAARAHAATIQAFTLRQHYETIGPHGDRVVQSLISARKSDGSSMNETDSPPFGWIERTIHRPTGIVQHVFDDVKTVSSTQANAGAYLAHLGAIRDPSSVCTLPFQGRMMEPDKLLAQENIGGIPTDKVQAGMSGGLLSWYAPALGCIALQHVRTFPDSTSKLVFDRLSLDEPDPKLFAVDPDYEELPPSQSALKHLRYGDVPEANVSQLIRNLATSDAHYAANRAPAP